MCLQKGVNHMKLSSFLYFAGFGLKTVLFRKKKPILGTVIVTDKCNLRCRHCSVNNITAVVHPFRQIQGEMRQLYNMGAPVFNLKSAFPYLIDNKFPTPCNQCVVIENGKVSTCGRCIEVPGLCEQCGYFFVAEYTLLFSGNIKIILETLKTYLKYI